MSGTRNPVYLGFDIGFGRDRVAPRPSDISGGTTRSNAWTISKREVASSELWRAIQLYIVAHDFISAHVLAAAASEIIHTDLEARGIRTRRSGFRADYGDQQAVEMERRINREYNFFKHGGGKKSASSSSYFPIQTELFLLEACTGIHAMTETVYLETMLYLFWFSARHPNLGDQASFKLNEEDELRAQLGDPRSPDFGVATKGLASLLSAVATGATHSEFPMLRDLCVRLTPERVTLNQ